MALIDGAPLKPASDAYKVARCAWDAAVSALPKATPGNTEPLDLQSLHDEAQQTHEAVFAAGAELAECVADAISRAGSEG